MRKDQRWLGWGLAVALAGAATAAQATIIWQKNFTDVLDWQIVFSQDAGATITSDTQHALLYVQAATSLTAFGPISNVSPLVPFDAPTIDRYFMGFTVYDETGSVSYDIGLDEFDVHTNYLATVLSVFPQQAFVGTTNLWLGSFTYDLANTVYLLPKVTVHTGLGDQTVYFTSIDFEVVPEPSTIALFVIGAGLLAYRCWQQRVPPAARDRSSA